MKIFGPYKGSKQNGGRPIYVIKRKKKNGTTETTSTNKARLDYKKATGKKLKRNQEVDHKDNKGRKGNDKISNLRVLSKRVNVGLGNKKRAKNK
jgi:mRNA-degrading endonuclease toxin of MazEF toxin-antitoxin module